MCFASDSGISCDKKKIFFFFFLVFRSAPDERYIDSLAHGDVSSRPLLPRGGALLLSVAARGPSVSLKLPVR